MAEIHANFRSLDSFSPTIFTSKVVTSFSSSDSASKICFPSILCNPTIEFVLILSVIRVSVSGSLQIFHSFE